MPEAAPVAAPTPAAPPPGGNGAAGHETPAGAEPPKPAAPPAPPKMFKVKTPSGEREVSEQTYHAYAQKAAAADEMLAQAKREREAVAAEKEELKAKFGSNWREALKATGVDPDAFLRQAVLSTYGQAEQTEEQKALAAEQRRAAEAEGKLAKYEQERLTQQQRAAHDRAVADYQARFVPALEKTGLVPADAGPEALGKSPLAVWAIQHMATLEEANLDAGSELPPEVLAEMVNSDLDEQIGARLGALEGDALLDRLDRMERGLSKKISKALVARYNARRAGADTLGSTGSVPTDPRAMPSPGRVVQVTLPPRDPQGSGKFVSREDARAERPFLSAFIPRSVTGGA